jgi:Fuc2NAc and GlcNAc transferase
LVSRHEDGKESEGSLMLLFVLLFVVSALITAGVRLVFVRRGLFDVPNSRSSHSVPVPRGGGVGIVVVFLSSVVWILSRNLIPARLAWALIVGGLAIAIAGFLDDRFGLPPWPRLAVHILAAGWAVWCLCAMQPLQPGSSDVFWTWVARAADIAALVWLTNLFNFMDGIDGLAGMEAVLVSAFGAVLMLQDGLRGDSQLSWSLAAASLGFLVWNWPPAKIFMGDIGSGFLGFTLGTLALFSSRSKPELLWSWLILLAAFLVDATFTLLRRMISRARWYDAHRNHAYQHAVQACTSHAKVTLAVAAINIGWLLPLAWAAYRYPQAAPAFAAVAFAPLVVIALRFEAGREQAPSIAALQD